VQSRRVRPDSTAEKSLPGRALGTRGLHLIRRDPLALISPRGALVVGHVGDVGIAQRRAERRHRAKRKLSASIAPDSFRDLHPRCVRAVLPARSSTARSWGLIPTRSEDDPLDAMVANPILISRPIIVTEFAPSSADLGGGPRAASRAEARAFRQRKTATGSRTPASGSALHRLPPTRRPIGVARDAKGPSHLPLQVRQRPPAMRGHRQAARRSSRPSRSPLERGWRWSRPGRTTPTAGCRRRRR